MGSKQDNRRNWFARHKFLTGGAATVVVVGGIVVNEKYVKPGREHRYLRSLAVQDSNLPPDEVDEYLRRGVFWKWINTLATKDVNVPNLDLLLSDSDVQQKAKRNKTNSINIILGIVNADPNIVPAFTWDEYYPWREKGGGAVGLQIAKSCKWDLENILKLPKVPSEDALSIFKDRNMSDQYFVPLLLNDVAITYMCEMHKLDIPIDYYIPLKQAGFEFYTMVCFWERSIPKEYALSKKGQERHEVIYAYSQDRLGIPDKERQEYRALGLREYMNDNRIELWREKGMTLNHLKEIDEDGSWYVVDAYDLVMKGDFSPIVYNDWIPDVSIPDTLFAIRHGYTKQEAMDVNLVYKISLAEFHDRRQKWELMDRIVESRRQQQPLSIGAPR